MLDLLFSNPFQFLLMVVSLIIALDIHEFSHAWMADKLGDPTPQINGRLTLDPRAHLDPLGTLALFLINFGWGKPVPIDPYNLRSPKRDTALISLAGPASNLILAIILSLIIRLTNFPLLTGFLIPLIILNVNLAVFNLIPFPPLDGAKILTGFLPHQWAWQIEESLERYGTVLLFLFLFPIFGRTSLIINIISPIINIILKILLPI